jgi:hypothetical protein
MRQWTAPLTTRAQSWPVWGRSSSCGGMTWEAGWSPSSDSCLARWTSVPARPSPAERRDDRAGRRRSLFTRASTPVRACAASGYRSAQEHTVHARAEVPASAAHALLPAQQRAGDRPIPLTSKMMLYQARRSRTRSACHASPPCLVDCRRPALDRHRGYWPSVSRAWPGTPPSARYPCGRPAARAGSPVQRGTGYAGHTTSRTPSVKGVLRRRVQECDAHPGVRGYGVSPARA